MSEMTKYQIYWTVDKWILSPDLCGKKSLQTLQVSIEDLNDFQCLLCVSLALLRENALNGKADTWLDTPALYDIISKLPGADVSILSRETITDLCKRVKEMHNYRIDGEMWYCVEDDFLKGIHKALLRRHEEFLKEKKRRFELLHEDLIAATLHPERVVRMATAFGLEAIDYLEAI